MPLPPPKPRSHVHTRQAVYRGYHREDGLWELEAELLDTKTYQMERVQRGVMPAGTPVHGMSIRLTLDDHMTIREVATAMDATPFGECQQSNAPIQKMVGVTIGPGWRQAIERALGANRGCTHLRELLFNMATVAYQTIPNYRHHLRRMAGVPEPEHDKPPYHVGRCIAWDVDGAVVKQYLPKFAGWPALRRPR